MANVSTKVNFTSSVSGTTNNSYYNVGPADQVKLDNIPADQCALNVATRLCAMTTDMTSGPGFATLSKPVLIHVLVFGAVFEVVAQPPAQQAQAFTLCQQLSAIGGTGFPSSITNTSDPNYYKICTGTQDQRASKLKQAFINIMDSNIPVSLIR